MYTGKKLWTLMSAGVLVVLGCLYFAVAGKQMADALNLHAFLQEKTTEILVFLGVGIALRFLLTRIDKRDFHFLADAIVVASTVGLLVEVQHLRESHEQVHVEGEWLYEVQDSNGNITHGGISTIQELRDGELFIDGRRKYKQFCDGNAVCTATETRLQHIINDGNYWSTDFAVLHGGESKSVDFVYTILLNGRSVRGYCHLTPDSKDKLPRKLEGRYTHLAPDTLMGYIVFTRMAKSEALAYIDEKVKNSNLQPPKHQNET